MSPISPLQLKNHFFTQVTVRANAKGSATAKPSLDTGVTFENRKDLPNQWILGLRVVLKAENPAEPLLYEATVDIHGLVEIHDSFAPEKREQLAVVNGLSLLYSAVREMLLNITARSVHGAWCLPSVNFVEIVASKKASALQQEAPTAPAEPGTKPSVK